MKLIRLLCSVLAFGLVSNSMKAEITVQLGNGNASQSSKGPWNQLQSNNRSKKVMLFTEGELAAQGIVPGVIIHAMKWYKTTNDSFINGATATALLYMRHANLPTGYGNGGQNVLNYINNGFNLVDTVKYNSSYNIGMSDWVGFTDFYFTYNGGDLEVYVDWQTSTGSSNITTTGNFNWKYSSYQHNKYMWYHGTPNNNSDFHIGNERPNTLFVFTIPNCGTAPVPGTIVTDAAGAMCQGQSFSLNLTGNSTSVSQTYIWQHANSASGPWLDYSVPMQQPLIGIDAPATSKWYRAKVTCGTYVAYSDTIQIQVTPGMNGGTYTINDAQPTGSGNFNSFHDAIVSLSCGITGPVTLNVVAGSGPYNEQVVIPRIGGASLLTPVTINGNGASISHVAAGPNERAVIKLDGADYITINNLNIGLTGTDSADYGFGVQLIHNADFNTINNCTIHINKGTGSDTSKGYAGIVINGHAHDPLGINFTDCDLNVISNNTIKGGYYGIVLMGNSEASTITGNLLSDNTIRDFYSYGIYAGNNSIAIIEGNDISRPERHEAGEFTGIQLQGYNASTLVLGNKIHDAFNAAQGTDKSATAIAVDNCNPGEGSEVVVANNVLYRFRSRGNQYGIKASGSGYVKFQHNTLALDFGDAQCANCGIYGFYQGGDAVSNLDFSNNNISIGGFPEGTMRAMHLTNGINSSIFNNNNYYVSPAVGSHGSIGSINGVNYASLLLWKFGVLGDLLSISENPSYQDPTSGNMRPTNTDMDNSGLQVGILVDITGTLRNLTTPDIGAYEFDENAVSVAGKAATNSALSIYPNPAIDIVYANYAEKLSMSISGIDGKVLLQESNTNQLDISSLPMGLYILKVTSKEGAILRTEKILKRDK
jgi:parallel beta-helix repeat protein